MGNEIKNRSLNTNLFSGYGTSAKELALQDKSATLLSYSKKTTIIKKTIPNNEWLNLARDITKIASENIQPFVALYFINSMYNMHQIGLRESLKTVLTVCEVEDGSACNLAQIKAEVMLCIDIICMVSTGYWVVKYFTKKQ